MLLKCELASKDVSRCLTEAVSTFCSLQTCQRNTVRQLPTVNDCWSSKIAMTFLTSRPAMGAATQKVPGCVGLWWLLRALLLISVHSPTFPLFILVAGNDKFSSMLASLLINPWLIQILEKSCLRSKTKFSYIVRRRNPVSALFHASYIDCENAAQSVRGTFCEQRSCLCDCFLLKRHRQKELS